MSDLRTRKLDNRYHKGYRWRSDWTRTCYRYNHGWEMFWDGAWVKCRSDYGNTFYELVGQCGETFVRVAEEVR